MVKVLIVDDAPDIVVLLAVQLKGQGYEVLTANSGREALEIAAAERPDVMLLDVVMPGMDGFEVCRRLKADERLRMIQVIMVTAQDRDADVVKGLDSGAEDYIAKPFSNAVLTARLRASLRLQHAYNAVARVNEELRLEIAERVQVEATLKKKVAELRQSQKMEAVGVLAGGIAHEFNNLLQAIGGYAQYAMQGLSPQEQRFRDLQEVINAADRATMLTRQLLGFSRGQVLQRKNINANQMLKDFAKMADPLIGEHISLEVALGEDVGTVYADPGELRQVFMNLCVNARDAMPSGGHLLLKTEDVFIREPMDAPQGSIWPGRYVRFSVADTGCGMSAEVQQRIFEPFFTTKEVGKGTGLGLSMVYGAVKQHHGAIRVRSEPGKGATFEIYIPTVAGNLEDETLERVRPAAGGSETILVAEDDPRVRNLTLRILENAGYTVLGASDGEEAWRLFQDCRNAISLVLLDAIMPGMTGREVYCRIKAEHPEMRVVFCSGYDPKTAPADFISQENLRLINKPFTDNTLLRTVRETLDEEMPCQLAIPSTT